MGTARKDVDNETLMMSRWRRTRWSESLQPANVSGGASLVKSGFEQKLQNAPASTE